MGRELIVPVPRCEYCGYDLSGLDPTREPRCSECGQRQTRVNDQAVLSRTRALLILLSPCLLSLLVAALLEALIWSATRLPMSASVWFLWPLIVAACVLGPLSASQVVGGTRKPGGILRSTLDVWSLALQAIILEVALIVLAIALWAWFR
jgi:hypothetical protein